MSGDSIREALDGFRHASDAERTRMFAALVGEVAAKDEQLSLARKSLWIERRESDELARKAADLREALRWARWAMEVRQASDAATDEPFDENIGEALLKIEVLAGVSPAQPAEEQR